MKKLLFVSIIVGIVSCNAAKLNRLKTCEFKYSGVENVIISGKNVDELRKEKKTPNSGLSVLGSLLFDKEVPVSFTVKILVTNPNKKKAALDKMEWTALIQGKELISGIYNDHFEVKPGETAVLTVPVSFDLKEKMSGENASALKSLGMGFMLNGNAKGLSLKIRPYVGGIKFPAAFEVKPF